jgi:hypothetical protein
MTLVIFFSCLVIVASAIILMGDENGSNTNRKTKKQPRKADLNKRPLTRRIIPKRPDTQNRRMARASKLFQASKTTKTVEEKRK